MYYQQFFQQTLGGLILSQAGSAHGLHELLLYIMQMKGIIGQ